MARIRSVKPEFWDSPSTAQASLRARLFYIAMWNWADDWGVGDANPRRLLGFAFPNDESSEVEPRNFRRLATEVAECYGVTWYEVDGRAYYAIPSWEEHQRTEKKARRAFPTPDQAERILYAEASEVPTPSSGNRQDGAGEQGSRGAGEKTRPPAPQPDTFDTWYQAYKRKEAKGDAITAYRKATRTIGADELLRLTVKWFEDRPTIERKFIPLPASWLNGQRWMDDPPPADSAPRSAGGTPPSSPWDRAPRIGDAR